MGRPRQAPGSPVVNKHTNPSSHSHAPIAANSLAAGRSAAASQPYGLGEGSYVATPADFPNGCLVRFDPQNRRRIATGENKLGFTVTLVLDVPLCSGCDAPLDAGVCSDCSMVFVEHLGPGRIAL
jgi:hypothetical protein